MTEGFDHYLSLIFDGMLRLRWPWATTIPTLFIAIAAGFFVGQFWTNQWFAKKLEGSVVLTDARGAGEFMVWGVMAVMLGLPRLVFESCFPMQPWDVTTCFTAADLSKTISTGLAIGSIFGLYRGVREREHGGRTPVVMTLRPVRPFSLVSIGSFVTVFGIVLYLTQRLLLG